MPTTTPSNPTWNRIYSDCADAMIRGHILSLYTATGTPSHGPCTDEALALVRAPATTLHPDMDPETGVPRTGTESWEHCYRHYMNTVERVDWQAFSRDQRNWVPIRAGTTTTPEQARQDELSQVWRTRVLNGQSVRNMERMEWVRDEILRETRRTTETPPETCAHCSEPPVHLSPDAVHPDHCDDCFAERYFVCAATDEPTPIGDGVERDDGETVSRQYAERNLYHSSIQDCWIPSDRSVCLEDSGDYVTREYAEDYCYLHEDNDCWYTSADEAPEPREMYPYSTNIFRMIPCKPILDQLSKGTLMFGVELEMEPDGGNQREIARLLHGPKTDTYILKEDGSLDDGVELVTVPGTLDWHRDTFNWERVLKPVQGGVAMSGSGTENCGMHVHINKKGLTALQIGKMLVFCNSDHNRAFIADIAQRPSNTYCQRAKKKLTHGLEHSASRYDILNVGAATVEVRMFKGNLNYKRVLKNIEFCHALTTYMRDCSMMEVEDYLKFCQWVKARAKFYPHLAGFLAEKDYIRMPAKKRTR